VPQTTTDACDAVAAKAVEHMRYLEAVSPVAGRTDFPYLNSNAFCIMST
jgi:hypothetical protein